MSIPGQPVRIDSSGQVVPITVTNDVVRVLGQLSISKARSRRPASSIRPGSSTSTTPARYGGVTQAEGTVSLAQGDTALTPAVFLGSACTVTEDPATLTDPPVPGDPSWVWLPPTYDPGQNVVVTSATTPVTVGVTNRIQRLTGGFNLTKVVAGRRQGGRLHPGHALRVRHHLRQRVLARRRISRTP